MTYDEKVQKVIGALEGGYDSEQEWGEAILKAIGIQRHYDPETYLQWAAEHLVTFRPAIDSSYMEYVGGDGETYHVTWLSKVHQPDTLSQLIGCVELAMGQEICRVHREADGDKRIERASADGIVVNTQSSFNRP
jgi:hypothetical protein